MSKQVAILMMIYHEPEWLETVKCVERHCGQHAVFFADRDGVGGLAGAFNRGYDRNCLQDYKFVWFLTNVVFSGDVLTRMVDFMEVESRSCAALTPTFASDHRHTCPVDVQATREAVVIPVPFVEFTCPLVRSDVFFQNPLDAGMPYSGHDLDWGYRIRKQGQWIGVHRGIGVGHVYIRHSASTHPATVARKALRDANEEPTKKLLAEKYGPDWFKLLRYKY